MYVCMVRERKYNNIIKTNKITQKSGMNERTVKKASREIHHRQQRDGKKKHAIHGIYGE